MGKKWKQWQILFIFLGSKITVDGDCSQKTFVPWKKSYDKPRQCIKKAETSLSQQRSIYQSYGFSSNYVWMWESDHKEGWAQKNRWFRIVVLQKTFESPLDSKDIKPVNVKGNQPWIFIGRTDAEAEAPVLWPPYAKRQFIGKDPDAGKDWGQEK